MRPIACVCLLTMSLLSPPAGAQAEAKAAPDVDEAVRRGLAFLARQQQPNGAMEAAGPRLAMTGLGLMAFLASGHTPDAGKFGLNVRNAVDCLLKHVPEDGYVGRVDGSRMYGQGIIALALIEAYGVEPDAERRKKLEAGIQKLLKVILDAQQVKKAAPHAGGWRYQPEAADSDLSLSGWNALALRAAQNAGFDVPKERVERAAAYVLRCYRADQKGFSYQPGREATAGMTGVGVLNLYLLDQSGRDELASAVRLLAEKPIEEDTRFAYYAHYYATQAAFQAGEPAWSAVWQNARRRLLELQQADGGFAPSRTNEEPGRVYATSMAVLTLSVPKRLLPIFQR